MPIQRLRDNLRVFEHLAKEVEMRAANMPENRKRVRVMRRLDEIQEHVAQLKVRITAGERHSETPRTSDWAHRPKPLRRSFTSCGAKLSEGGR
jgi:hypothetical protein